MAVFCPSRSNAYKLNSKELLARNDRVNDAFQIVKLLLNPPFKPFLWVKFRSVDILNFNGKSAVDENSEVISV